MVSVDGAGETLCACGKPEGVSWYWLKLDLPPIKVREVFLRERLILILSQCVQPAGLCAIPMRGNDIGIAAFCALEHFPHHGHNRPGDGLWPAVRSAKGGGVSGSVLFDLLEVSLLVFAILVLESWNPGVLNGSLVLTCSPLLNLLLFRGGWLQPCLGVGGEPLALLFISLLLSQLLLEQGFCQKFNHKKNVCWYKLLSRKSIFSPQGSFAGWALLAQAPSNPWMLTFGWRGRRWTGRRKSWRPGSVGISSFAAWLGSCPPAENCYNR